MKLCVVAGEASGDLQASAVVRELKVLDPALELFGIGGDLLDEEGMRLLAHARDVAITGLFNVLRHLPMFRKLFSKTMDAIRQERPDAVLLVDYPDFNLRLAAQCRREGFRVIYYISPQVWAWRRGRVRQIARDVDHMIVIFPFEAEFYAAKGVPVTYVGHPLVEQFAADVEQRRLPLPDTPLKLALLPGSRRVEITALLPPMLDAVEELRRTRAIDPFLLQAPTISREEIVAAAAGRSLDGIRLVDQQLRETLAEATVALTSSGTATLELALLEIPSVIMYRLGRATYALARRLVKVEHIGLTNIVAGKRVVPELVQDDVNGPAIAAEVRKLLDPATYVRTVADLKTIRERMGEPGASRRAAETIHDVMSGR